MALRGHPGHVFQEREGKFLVNPALSLFHPCEVALLNQVSLNSFNLQGEKSFVQVLELAADYRTVASFISRHGSGGEEGMYLEAVTDSQILTKNNVFFSQTVCMYEPMMTGLPWDR